MSDFLCNKCGKCCSNFLPLLESEIKTMKKLKKKENIQALNMNWYSICPFLNSDNKCDIYENRPFICRSYTCYKFENKIVDTNEFKKYKPDDFKLVDIRAEIFNRTRSEDGS